MRCTGVGANLQRVIRRIHGAWIPPSCPQAVHYRRASYGCHSEARSVYGWPSGTYHLPTRRSGSTRRFVRARSWGTSNLRPTGSLYTAGAACSVESGVSDSVNEPTICQGEAQRLMGSRTRSGECWALGFAAQTGEPGKRGRGQLNEGPLLGNERENHNVAGLPS